METSLKISIYEEMCLTIKPQTPLKPRFLVTERGLQARAERDSYFAPLVLFFATRIPTLTIRRG